MCDQKRTGRENKARMQSAEGARFAKIYCYFLQPIFAQLFLPPSIFIEPYACTRNTKNSVALKKHYIYILFINFALFLICAGLYGIAQDSSIFASCLHNLPFLNPFFSSIDLSFIQNVSAYLPNQPLKARIVY